MLSLKKIANLTSWKYLWDTEEKTEKLYHEQNDIQLLSGIETSAETTTLILETV